MRKHLWLLSLLLLLQAGTAQAAALRVLTLGDSVVQGVVGNFRTPLKQLLEAEGLEITYVGTNRDSDGNLHAGHGGWTPAQALLHFHGNIQADVYVIYLGLNGMTGDTLAPGPEGYGPHVAFVRGILDVIYDRNPSAQVVLAQIGHCLDPASEQGAHIAVFNRQLERMASAYGRADSLRLAHLEQALAGDPANFLDCVHPNQLGYARMAQALFPPVRDAARAAGPSPWLVWSLVALAAATGLAVLAWSARRSLPRPQ